MKRSFTKVGQDENHVVFLANGYDFSDKYNAFTVLYTKATGIYHTFLADVSENNTITMLAELPIFGKYETEKNDKTMLQIANVAKAAIKASTLVDGKMIIPEQVEISIDLLDKIVKDTAANQSLPATDNTQTSLTESESNLSQHKSISAHQ